VREFSVPAVATVDVEEGDDPVAVHEPDG